MKKKIKEEVVSAVAANAIGNPGEPIATFSPLMSTKPIKRKKLREIIPKK